MSLAPIRFSVIVPLEPADAFDLFTTRMGRWWPLIDHSISTTSAETCVVEAVAGGRVYEISRSGETHLWGEVLIADRPHRVVMTWHPGGGPATEVEVTFTAASKETLVELEHRKWEALGKAAVATRDGYLNGWPYVFVERFAAGADAAARGEM
ncbi:MAG: SRPBCC domain-containing protein [Thermoanaerobaculia bacterium]|nr:SRPBCC domain-containing protein [Thermoanaerobaculia bacterium]